MTHLVTLLLALLIWALPVTAAAPTMLPAVAPLSLMGRGIVCTAFSVNEKKHYWVTAKHCISSTAHYTIGSEPATVVDQYDVDDLAILKTGLGAPQLELAREQPVVGDSVATVGYPAGSATMVSSWGRVMTLDIKLAVNNGWFAFPDVNHYMLFTMPVLGGHSGSPVFHAGKVISVMQVGSEGFSGGLGWSQLIRDLKRYTR